MKQSTGTNIQVAVRCRPLNSDEKKAGMTPAVTCDIESKAININYGNAVYLRRRNLTFDHVFGPYSRQEEVFESLVRPMIDDTLSGFNCTIFAYGQTGTGKTHTMEGIFGDNEECGIVPRAVKSIYGQLEQSGAEFTIRVSYLELYNEELLDLFDPFSSKKLQLCEDSKKGVVCQNLEEIPVISMEHILEILQRGFKQRQSATTLMNKNSSRSHSIFTMKIMIKEFDIDGEEVVRHGQLNLVDLAGSECVGRSGAKEERAREAGSINQSLLTLGRVINALVEHHGHIPYRDSKLTRLLQDSLGGRSKTSIIATLSPSSAAVDETISTLEYAFRAKTIKNQPVVNQKMSKHVIMKDFMNELETLRGQLQQTREKVGVYLKPTEFADLQAKIRAQESQLQECEMALKVRTEEMRVNKLERDEFAAKYEKNQNLLAKTMAELYELNIKHDKQSQQLKDTAIELHATGNVVSEQVVTEKHLYSEGQKLEKDLHSRNNDITRLLSKIDALALSDQAKSAQCNQFVNELQDNQRKLLSQVEVAKLATRQDIDALIQSNHDLLSASQDTYSKLQSVVSTCLSKIQIDTSTASGAISTLQGSVKGDLQTMLTEVTDSLEKLQDVSLAPLFANLYARINHAENLMESHQAQLEDIVFQIHTHFSSMSAKSAEFLKQQEKFREALIHATNRMKEDVSAQLEFQKSHAQSYVFQAETAMSAKVTEIEMKMKAMLRDLVSESSALLDKGVEESEVIANDTNCKVTEKADAIIAAGEAHYTAYIQHVESEKKEVAEFNANSELKLKSMQQCYDGIRPQHSQMRQTIEEVKTAVSQSSSEIISSTQSTVSNGCEAADAIEATSVQLQQNISSNTVESAAEVKGSTEYIAAYLSERHSADAEKLSGMAGELETHFLSEEEYLTHESKAASSLHAELTPLCPIYAAGEQVIRRPIPTVCDHRQTRLHSLIKDEVREKLLPLQLETILEGNLGGNTRIVASPMRSPMVEINCSRSRSVDSTTGTNIGKNSGLVPESDCGFPKKKKESGKENNNKKLQQKTLAADMRIGSLSFEDRNSAAEPAIALDF